jgi:hypothetical protein
MAKRMHPKRSEREIIHSSHLAGFNIHGRGFLISSVSGKTFLFFQNADDSVKQVLTLFFPQSDEIHNHLDSHLHILDGNPFLFGVKILASGKNVGRQ